MEENGYKAITSAHAILLQFYVTIPDGTRPFLINKSWLDKKTNATTLFVSKAEMIEILFNAVHCQVLKSEAKHMIESSDGIKNHSIL